MQTKTPASLIGTRRARHKSAAALRCALSLALALAVACPVWVPSGAHAAPRPSDRIDGSYPKDLKVPVDALPDVNMKAGALVTSDGRVLWARNAEQKRAIASLTKIMTAVVALEESDLGSEVVVPRDSAKVGESTAFLRPGERLPLSEVFEGLLVKSGNDAAVTVAEHVSGSEKAFVGEMNRKAAELGLTKTRFANSHGLDAKGHYSSALDLAILSRYAMTKPEFRKVVGTKVATIGSGKRGHKVENTNVLIGNYVGANGVKTGYTSDAGYSLVESAKRGPVELYAVVLGTPSDAARFREARELLDWGFAHYRMQALASEGTVIGGAPVTDYLDVTVGAAVSEDTSIPVLDVAGPITRSVKVASVTAPVEKGERVGVATFTQRGRVVATIPLVADVSVAKPSLPERAWIGIVRAWRRLAGSGPLVAAPAPA